jgi:serine/threonine protein kinase
VIVSSPSNLSPKSPCIDRFYNCKIADFGLSKILGDASGGGTKKSGSFLMNAKADERSPNNINRRLGQQESAGSSERKSNLAKGHFPNSGSLKTFTEHDLSAVGTPAFTAPEVIRCEKYSQAADVYSFGIVVVEVRSVGVAGSGGVAERGEDEQRGEGREGVRGKRKDIPMRGVVGGGQCHFKIVSVLSLTHHS